MKKTLMGMTMAMAACFSAVLPQSMVMAQSNSEPAMVMAIAPADEQLKDIGYLTKAAGQAQMGGLVQLMAGDFLRPLHTDRPMGAYVMLDSPLPSVVGFMPLKDKEALVEVVSEQLGDPDEDGDFMIFTSPEGDEIYMLPKGDWCFMSNMKESLTNLPADPAPYLKGLEDYNVAVRINGQNIPAEMKQMAIGAMQAGFDEMLNELEQVDPDQAELQRQLNAGSFDQMVDLINDMDEVVIGWAVDEEKQGTYFDFSFTGVAGSKIADQSLALSGAESRFLGFLLKDAAVNLNFITKMADADIEQLTGMIDSLVEQGLGELEDDPSMSPMEKELATDLVKTLAGVGKATIEGGTLDGGMAIVMDKNATAMVAGAHVEKAKDLENAVKKLVGMVEGNAPPGVEFNLDAEQQDGVNYHQIVIPVPENEEEAQDIFGEELNVWLGVSENTVYLAIGKGARDTLNTAIADSKMAEPKPARYAEGQIDIGKIITFAAEMQDEPELMAMADAMDGKDAKMAVYGETIENGARSRLMIGEGFISAIGSAVNQAMSAFGGGAQF